MINEEITWHAGKLTSHIADESCILYVWKFLRDFIFVGD